MVAFCNHWAYDSGMLITGLAGTNDVLKRYSDSRGPLRRWVAIVETAQWQNIMELRRTFPSADLIKDTAYTCFNLGGNKYRLITIVSYALQAVAVVELLTHAEYDRKY